MKNENSNYHTQIIFKTKKTAKQVAKQALAHKYRYTLNMCLTTELNTVPARGGGTY